MNTLCIVSFLLITSLIHAINSWNLNDVEPIVQTRYGQLRGRRSALPKSISSDVRISSFIGVPYAQPPIGINRFSDPQEMPRWSGILDASNNRVMCPQVEQRFRFDLVQPIRESEDCLYMNIQVLGKGNSMLSSPVLVYFPGGEFKYGGKDFYYLDNLPIQLASQSGLIFVTVNYRLGPLGFLSTDTNDLHGNYGLKDMIAALRWIQSEISQFHGDPSKVFIGGHDAGGIAVSMLLLATHNERLFTGAFASGGTVFTPWAFERSPETLAKILANGINCYPRNLHRCLKEKSYTEIMNVARLKNLHFRPTIDRNLSLPLFQDEPEIQYSKAFFAKVPFIVGVTEKEGALDYYLNYEQVSSIETIREKIKFLIRPYVRRWSNIDIMATLIEYQYFGEDENRSGRQYSPTIRGNRILDPSQMDERLIQMLGDYLYNLPAEKALYYHSRGGGKAKFYVYTYDGDRSKATFGVLQKDLSTRVSRDRFSTTHMDDIFAMFSTVYGQSMVVQETDLLPSIITELRDGGGMSSKWLSYAENNRHFMRVASFGRSSILTNFKSDRAMAFWNNLFTQLEMMTVIAPPYFPESEYYSYQAATWSLMVVSLLMILIALALAIFIYLKRRNEKRSLKLIRQRNGDYGERTYKSYQQRPEDSSPETEAA